MKKPKTNYYLGEVEEHNGEYEYNQKYLFETSGNPKEYAEKVAREWYGNENPEKTKEEDGFWHNGEVVLYVGSVQKIPKEHYKIMKRYLLEM
jgi:hypothetical protein